MNDAAARAPAPVDGGERAPRGLLDAPAELDRDLVERRDLHARGRYSGAPATARSIVRAAASTVMSAHLRPTSCTAIGKPASNPVGTLAAGAPGRLAGSMNT